MSAQRFRKRPVVIEAVKYDGSSTGSDAIRHWIDTGEYVTYRVRTTDVRSMSIPTLEGAMIALPGDWIIKGVQGEFYPCKPDIFEATYKPVTP